MKSDARVRKRKSVPNIKLGTIPSKDGCNGRIARRLPSRQKAPSRRTIETWEGSVKSDE